jgi:hypothetical protein
MSGLAIRMTGYKYAGREVDDTILYYGAVPALSRSLRFYAEAKQQISSTNISYISVAIFLYYSIFHLAIFMALCLPDFLSDTDRSKINNYIARKDISRALAHKTVKDILVKLTEAGLDARVSLSFDKSKRMREFVNYGPDAILDDKEEYLVHNKLFSVDDCHDIFNTLRDIILTSVQWAHQKAPYDGALVRAAIGEASAFFSGNRSNQPLYAVWSSECVLHEAEELRALLALPDGRR